MIQKWVLACGFFGIYGLSISQDNTSYINRYKDIAVAEMIRTGIPASIKLAQGMLESNCGKSDLACKANNHFGIKCGNDWSGKCFKKEDDDFEDGKLVKSCFREFPSVNDSYVAHSDFLSDPAKACRYGFLFKLEPTDYKAWAHGLSKAGYASDPHYAERLIDIIEKNDLYNLDQNPAGQEASSSKGSKTYRPVHYYNDIKYIIANANESPVSLAAQLDINARQIVKYNDDINSKIQMLVPGSRVYLQSKRNKYSGHLKYHMLKEGEDLATISQQYGIKLSELLKRNGLVDGQVPKPNQKLALKGKIKNELLIVDPYAKPVEKIISESNSTANKNSGVVIKEKSTNYKVQETKVDTVVPATSLRVVPGPEYTVSKGDTLYGIARMYGMSVEDLKKINNLSADTISVGQKLAVK